MTGTRLLCGALLTLALGACASSDDIVHQDAASIDPWCEREIRAARSQPIPAGASHEEASILRSRHMSLGCGRAYNESRSVRVPITGRDRIPSPVPPRRPE